MEEPQTNRRLVLRAPLSGLLAPIERVPDPVFSQKMVGDGIALDPISEVLLAPCDVSKGLPLAFLLLDGGLANLVTSLA